MTCEKYAVYVPKVGDGNPLHAHALADELDAKIIELDGITRAIGIWHRLMTVFRSEQYTNNSESVRSGFLAHMAAALLRYEVLLENQGLQPNAAGIFVQEHLLMNMSQKELNHQFPGGVYLAIPDVFPKLSARKIAIEKQVTLLVWNHDSYSQESPHAQTILIKPNLYASYTGNYENFNYQGTQFVMKTSGSGMPQTWISQMQHMLSQTDIDYQLFLPEKILTPNHITRLPNDTSRKGSLFFNSLGKYTKIFCSYPSEEIQVVAEMYQQGWNGIFLAFPPRGNHEKQNLKFAKKHGYCQGIINVGYAPDIAEEIGLPCIDIYGIPNYINTPCLTRPDLTILGDKNIQDAIISAGQ